MSEAPLNSFKDDDAAWGTTKDHPHPTPEEAASSGTSLIRNTPNPPRTTTGPWAQSPGRVRACSS